VATQALQQILEERSVRGGRRIALAYTDMAAFPAILLVPRPNAPPTSGALLLHGYTSRKEDVADSIGRALLNHGVASLTIELPFDVGLDEADDEMAPHNLVDLSRHWTAAVEEATAGLRYLSARPEVDAARVGIVGSSLGSYLGLRIAIQEAAVVAVVLAAAGDLSTESRAASLMRDVIDPLSAVRQLAGRPLLMVNGRHDTMVHPHHAERLYAAAADPKELRWHDGDHWLPPQAVQYAAEWLAARLGEIGKA
jgi:uncharacterized protein